MHVNQFFFREEVIYENDGLEKLYLTKCNKGHFSHLSNPCKR